MLITARDAIVHNDCYPLSPRIRTPARDPSQASTGAAPARHHRRRPMSTPRRSSTITGGVNEMNPITAPADLGRRCGGARPTDRLVQGVPAPGRARPGRDGRALRGRYHGTGVAIAAGLRQLSQPTGRLLATGAKRCHLMALPRLQPIIPTLRKEPFDDPGWLFDGRYGFPALCYVERGRARFVSRNGKSLDRFAALRAEVAAELAVDEAVLDGEVIEADATGRPQFYDLLWQTVRICALCRWASGGRRCGASCRRSLAGDHRSGVGRGSAVRVLRLDVRARSRGIVAKRLADPYGPCTRWLNQESRLHAGSARHLAGRPLHRECKRCTFTASS